MADHVKADIPQDARAHLLDLTTRSQDVARAGSRRRARAARDRLRRTWRLFVNVSAEGLTGSAGSGQRKRIRKDR